MKKVGISENADDGSLIRSWQQGNEEAFEKLYHRHFATLFKYVSGIVVERVVAEEIVMDVMMAIWKRKEFIDWKIPIRHLLMRSARNRSIDFLRQKARIPVVPLIDKVHQYVSSSAINNVDALIFSKEMENMYQRRLIALAPRKQIAFRLSRECGLSHAEIADRMGLSRNTVENHIVHVLEEFRRHFRNPGFRDYIHGGMMCGRKKLSSADRVKTPFG